MSVVREELGPSLPQLIAPYWQPLSRGRRIVAVVVAVGLVVLLVVGRFALRAAPLTVEVVPGPAAFNLIHRADFRLVRKRPGELLRLEGVLPGTSGAKESFVVQPLTLPRYRGDVSTAYLLLASQRLAQLEAADPAVRYRGEGKARINTVTFGYQLLFQTRTKTGKLLFGKRVFVAPDPLIGQPQSRAGLELTLLTERSGQTPSVADVGSDVLLKSPLRSLRFGTDRP